MQFLVKNIGVVLVVVVVLFRDTIFGTKDYGSRGDLDKEKSDYGSTISDLQAEAIAEQLFNIMVSWFRSDYDDLLPIWKRIKKDADYNKVYNAFKKRQYSVTWKNGGDPLTSDKYDLTSWLNYETSEETRVKLTSANPNVTIWKK